VQKRDAYHHGDLRAGLVEAARALVEAKGPDRLSLSDCCRASGVSTAAPYRHFADKDDLLLSVALEGLGRQRRAMQAATEGHPPGSTDAIAAMGLAYVTFAQAEPGVFRLMFALSRSLRDSGPLLEAGRDTFGVLLQQMTIRMGKPGVDAEVIARSFPLWTFVHGLSFLLIDEKAQAMEVSLDLPAMIRDNARRLLAD
jgi:AcrR family transcriptional regulator